MAEGWEYELAGQFKQRDNPNPTRLGACIGKVESLSPVIISIQSGKFMLQENQIYICNQILERETTFRNFNANGSLSVSCPISAHSGAGYSESNATGRVHLDEVWRVGDYVMVVPDETEQHFFIVDILRTPNGSNPSLG